MNPEQLRPPNYYQLRVRISSEEKEAILRITEDRGGGETISDLVRVALKQMVENSTLIPLSPVLETKINTLASDLKRDSDQVKKACIEGIFDMIEGKAKVPLIVMESQLHISYRNSETNTPLN